MVLFSTFKSNMKVGTGLAFIVFEIPGFPLACCHGRTAWVAFFGKVSPLGIQFISPCRPWRHVYRSLVGPGFAGI